MAQDEIYCVIFNHGRYRLFKEIDYITRDGNEISLPVSVLRDHSFYTEIYPKKGAVLAVERAGLEKLVEYINEDEMKSFILLN